RTTRLDVGVVDVVVLAPTASTPAGARASRWQLLTLRRAPGVRCPGAWELVHGRLEAGETPAEAARREVREETGLEVARLYSVGVSPFYLPRPDTLQLAVVFAAVVEAPLAPQLGPEHDAARWRTPVAALRTLAWPREHEAARHALHLLRTGDAGPVEDVLRVPSPPR
ncbi:MAG: NUDIX hydrolase, partial [Gemmatimonadetes bacterium]|nr:NUDIX hydrolase [Gemmatimonadota bacterium]